MKYALLLLITFACCANDTIGQTSSWADSSSVWYYNYPPSDFTQDPRSVFYRMAYRGDTILDGIQCAIIGDSITQEYMYQEDDLVYYWEFDQFHIVYDFGAEQGDTVEFAYRAILETVDTILNVQAVVESTYNLFINGESLKRLHVRVVPDLSYPLLVWPTMVYTERIGSETVMIEVLDFPTVNDIPLLRCFDDSHISYTTNWWEWQGKPCDFQIIPGVEQPFSDPLVTIYPNPATDHITIELPTTEGLMSSISIMDLTGKEIMSIETVALSSRIDINHLAPGMYLLTLLLDDGSVISTKIVKR